MFVEKLHAVPTGKFANCTGPRFLKFTIKYIGNIKTAQQRSQLHNTANVCGSQIETPSKSIRLYITSHIL